MESFEGEDIDSTSPSMLMSRHSRRMVTNDPLVPLVTFPHSAFFQTRVSQTIHLAPPS
jgi:hypothetical protein